MLDTVQAMTGHDARQVDARMSMWKGRMLMLSWWCCRVVNKSMSRPGRIGQVEPAEGKVAMWRACGEWMVNANADQPGRHHDGSCKVCMPGWGSNTLAYGRG
jgi:hypothetical protein